MEACIAGGFRIIEFTLTTPNALALIREFSAKDGLIVGAGTVLDVGAVEATVKAGARFIVSPVMDPVVIQKAHELGALAIPGTSSPTEMWQATLAGAHVVKLFPAVEKNPAYVRSCLGPFPELRIMPTSGVTAENARAYLAAGAFALGFVQPLFDAAELAADAFDKVSARARTLLELVRSSPGPH